MHRLFALAAVAALAAGCMSLRDQPYDDDDLSARARPGGNAAAFMGYHGPVQGQAQPGETEKP